MGPRVRYAEKFHSTLDIQSAEISGISEQPTHMITCCMAVPDGLKGRLLQAGFLKEIHSTETRQRGASNYVICVQRGFGPEYLCHCTKLLFYVLLGELVEMCANNHVRSPAETTGNQFREASPIVTWELFK